MPSQDDTTIGRGDADTAEAVLAARGLAVSYGGRPILKDVTFSVRKGEIFVVLAAGGGGKTTLFRHLLALEPCPVGAVSVLGQDMGRLSGRPLASLRRQIGAVHQHGALISSLSILENIVLVLSELTDLDRETIPIIARLKLDQVGLLEFETYRPGQLSAGMVLRAAIARALALDPKLVLCDDIFSGVDRRSLRDLKDLVRQLREAFRQTVVILTHGAEPAMEVADRLAVLHRGTVIFCGTPAELSGSAGEATRAILQGEVEDRAMDGADLIDLLVASG